MSLAGWVVVWVSPWVNQQAPTVVQCWYRFMSLPAWLRYLLLALIIPDIDPDQHWNFIMQKAST
jgi:hypothetical protein